MPYPTDPQQPSWMRALTALGPMVAAGFAGQGAGMGAFGENYARGAAVAEEMRQRDLQLQQREQEQAWRQAEAERNRVDQQNDQAFRLLEYYPKLREQALDLAERNGMIEPDLMASHAAGTMKDYHAAITRAFPFMQQHAGLLESMGQVTPEIASTRLREKMRPYYEKIRESVNNDDVQLEKLRQSRMPMTPWQIPFAQLEAVVGMAGLPGKRDQDSAIYKEWKEYTKEGGKLTFDQYMTMDANRKRPVTNLNMAGPGGGLTPDAVEFAGTQYRITGQMPPLGMGSSGARTAIVNEAARQAKVLGKTPAAAIQAQASYQGDKSSLAKIRLLSSSAAAFEQKAIAQADIIRDLSQKVSRTSWPIINEGLLGWKKNVAGDRDTQLLYNAIITYAAEYGKIIEGSTGSAAGSTDSARRAAAELISPALAKGTLSATLDLMNREMGLTMQGYDAVIDHITKRMMGEEGYDSATPRRETTATVPGGIPDGTPVVFPDKSVGYWDATLGRAVRGVKK